MSAHCMPSPEPFLQSKPNQVKDMSAGPPSFLLPRQERLGAPISEQVQDMLVLTGSALKHWLDIQRAFA